VKCVDRVAYFDLGVGKEFRARSRVGIKKVKLPKQLDQKTKP
jgi:hypothetical protein